MSAMDKWTAEMALMNGIAQRVRTLLQFLYEYEWQKHRNIYGENWGFYRGSFVMFNTNNSFKLFIIKSQEQLYIYTTTSLRASYISYDHCYNNFLYPSTYICFKAMGVAP